ncbi:MAG: N-acetylneuraminate synthase [Nitrospina sp.]|nr:N-acetylneuraminate synthase family protein [Candidatus Nitrosopelagicus brevis]AJA92415.1 NeuB family protein [Candidatus Nitrosopelagicus brevis]MAR69729.1 N-acetylneuraminate synthase [Nitrospina sp.]|tara:strand:- start:1309 stop:2142 length:834 start_codon:yes stop_codon:yes gene_type:complete
MVFIVAEIGINHNGSIDTAKKLIDVAVSAGCDAVKFQKRSVEKVYSKKLLDSPRDSPWGKTQRAQKNGLEFSISQYKIIDRYCKSRKIPWYVSCWDIDSQTSMRKFKTKYNKVASAMLIHTKLLETIAKEKKYTFISTGMSSMKEIETAVKIFKKFKCPFELMHSHSAYPMPVSEANLKIIQTLKKQFKCNVGYSGHESSSYIVSLSAVLLGATSIERHITLDRSMYGSDQAASLEPDGLHRLVRDIRIVDQMLGNGKKRIWESELPAKKKLREILT